MSAPDLTSPMEMRVLWLERMLNSDAAALQRLLQRATAAEQEAWDLWGQEGMADPGYTMPISTPISTPNATLRGTIAGCTTTGIAATVAIYDGATLLWSGSTGGTGTYISGSFYISGTTSVTVVATPTSGRNAATTVTRSINPGTNTNGSVTCAAATGYVCTAVCPLAISTTLTLSSSGACGANTFPSDTLTFSTSPTPGWYGTATFTLAITGAATYTYQFVASTLGSLGLAAIPTGAGLVISLANPLLTSCASFSCQTICAAQGIGCTISD